MGTFHRRLANTRGSGSGTRFFARDWGEDGEAWYRLPETARKALELEPLV